MSEKRKPAIKDFQGWISSYKDRRGDLMMLPENGTLVVLNPKQEFPVRRGYDAISILQRNAPNKLRETAIKQVGETAITHKEIIDQAQTHFQTVEQQLLEKVKEWKTVQDPIVRFGITKEIGVLQKQVSEAATTLQSALSVSRYGVNEDIVELLLEYETKRMKKKTISILRSYPITLQERTFTEEKKA